MPPTRRAKPITVLEGRRLYEQTNLPVAHIAAMMGMSRSALYRRIRAWGWRRRRASGLPEDLAQRVAEASPAETTLAERSVDLATTAANVLRTVESEIEAVADILRQLPPIASEERERGQRMLASLARTLQELARLKLPNGATGQDMNDRGPADDDEFVRELIRRMDAFAERAQAVLPGEPAGGDA